MKIVEFKLTKTELAKLKAFGCDTDDLVIAACEWFLSQGGDASRFGGYRAFSETRVTLKVFVPGLLQDRLGRASIQEAVSAFLRCNQPVRTAQRPPEAPRTALRGIMPKGWCEAEEPQTIFGRSCKAAENEPPPRGRNDWVLEMAKEITGAQSTSSDAAD
jgi:hypothetical protein